MTGTSIGARLRLSARGAISGTLDRNHAVLPEGRFDTTLAKLRVDWSFSTRAALNALVQYNSARRAWLTNVRFSLMHRPLSDVFVVYTDTRPDGAPAARSVALKPPTSSRSDGGGRALARAAYGRDAFAAISAGSTSMLLIAARDDKTVRHVRLARQAETTRCRR